MTVKKLAVVFWVVMPEDGGTCSSKSLETIYKTAHQNPKDHSLQVQLILEYK